MPRQVGVKFQVDQACPRISGGHTGPYDNIDCGNRLNIVAEAGDARAARQRRDRRSDAGQRGEALASIKAFFLDGAVDLASALLEYRKSISN